jgi:membrane-associated phospholipid phosphatase/tRNA A-37 threonylcarbamoyl transferase component Bud32
VVVLGLLLRTVINPHDVESAFLRTLQDARTSLLTDVAKALNWLALPGVVLALRIATVVTLAVYKRWRHLVTFLATFVVVDAVAAHLGVPRAAPAGVSSLVTNDTFVFPSIAVSALSATVFGMAVSLAPPGSFRRRATVAAGLLVGLVALARAYLGADYLLDAAYAAVLGWLTVEVAFAAFVPEESFPVSYRRGGKSAHLDLGGERGRAIVRAVEDQLGITVTDVEPFGQEGSGGSTPLRMRAAELDGHLFGKLFATSHMRSDRWYKVGRTIMYGRLEDEVPFGSVRKLVEYEDYALRLLDDVGVRVARTFGVVELTPDREYMLVTEFFEGAETLGHADVDDTVIDDGMELIHALWRSGLAHRDVKPANLLVKDGRLQLIDVSGLEVRPTPWRQAVDLANMMMTLALRSDPDRVYERALLRFTPGEIAEAFAAARGLAIPTQLQSALKDDPRPVLGRFRELAPDRPPISIQRWSVQRVGVTAATVAGLVAIGVLFVDSLTRGLA